MDENLLKSYAAKSHPVQRDFFDDHDTDNVDGGEFCHHVRVCDECAGAMRAAVKVEREVCAEIADRAAGKGRTIGDTKAIAKAIRARH